MSGVIAGIRGGAPVCIIAPGECCNQTNIMWKERETSLQDSALLLLRIYDQFSMFWHAVGIYKGRALFTRFATHGPLIDNIM